MRSILYDRALRAAAIFLAALFMSLPALPRDGVPLAVGEIAYAALPPEARATLALIKKGGPYAYPRDGAVFGNYQRRLPLRKRGYYLEYTVATPGINHRGERRIVAAARGGEYFYTDDHYRSFKRIRE